MKVALSGSALIAALASGILGAEAHASPNTHRMSHKNDMLARRHHDLSPRSVFSKRGVPAATAKSILKRGSQTIVSDQPDNIAEGTATADEGCTQWVQPVDGDSSVPILSNDAKFSHSMNPQVLLYHRSQ